MTPTFIEEPDGKIRRYWVYGLVLESEVPFPELIETEITASNADVTLRLGSIDADNPEWTPLGHHFKYTDTAYLTTVSPDCRLLCRNGNEIIVDVAPGFSWLETRTHILGGKLAVLLQQRGHFAFHVSAVETPQGAWIFTGASGAGKSTSAAILGERMGWPLITDDVALIRMVDDVAMISGGVTKVKLWEDSIDMLALNRSSGQPDTWRHDKFHFLARQNAKCQAFPVARFFLIEPDQSGPPEPISGFQCVDHLEQSIFRRRTTPLFQAAKTGPIELLRLAGAIPMYRTGRLNEKTLAAMCEGS
ncbi:hypothetical protein [Sulfitobacter sp. JB4-11]|uniref:hypothetical protein n=1 Tax=Sulfitobacter rhodophyticola TaxID=3238304 RepID=UPI003512647B